MRVRLGCGVKVRQEAFGGICYVPCRDDFFAIDATVFPFVAQLTPEWHSVARNANETFIALAKFGICETKPGTDQSAYSGPSFLGAFVEIPSVSEPLVVNCFCTAHCPLRCVYCHADDLMMNYRPQEADGDIKHVIDTTLAIPSLVAVITGGDPLSRPSRARNLIEGLSEKRALVLDTSGVGDIRPLMATLVRHQVHVRISLDSATHLNDRLRPVNRKISDAFHSSRITASETIKSCLEAGLNVSVQTVLHPRNEGLDELRHLREFLVELGVRNWVLHFLIRGGKARTMREPADNGRDIHGAVGKLIQDTRDGAWPIDIRCSDTRQTPNSVLLVSSKGDLYTEGFAHNGKVMLYAAGDSERKKLREFSPYLDRFGHTRRYLNWNPWSERGRNLGAACQPIPIPAYS